MEGVAHVAVAQGGVGGGPVVAWRRGAVGGFAGAVGEVAVVGFWQAADVFVGPVGGRPAVVVFEVIDAPLGEGFGVDQFVSNAAWVVFTGCVSCRAVDAQLEAEGVNLVC